MGNGEVKERDPLLVEIDEYFWGGYLSHLARIGAVTADTPPAEIWQMKAEFMAGLRGEPVPEASYVVRNVATRAVCSSTGSREWCEGALRQLERAHPENEYCVDLVVTNASTS